MTASDSSSPASPSLSTTIPGTEPAPVSFREALAYWFKLGFISFGGPAGQIAMMHAELVERRRWISERRFLHALNYCMLLPGPEATQLATYIGWLMHGTWGGIVAGVLFVLPSVVILMALSWIYVLYGNVPVIAGVFYGVKPAVVAIVTAAVLRIGSRAVTNPATFALAVGAFAALVADVSYPWIVLAAGVCGYLGAKVWPHFFALGGHRGQASKSFGPALIDDHHDTLDHTLPSRARFALHLAVGLSLWALPMAGLYLWQGIHGTHFEMGWFFTQAALITFGGAYAVLPYITQQALDAHWLVQGQMIDGLALGETTPGPLIMVVAFVGFVGGWQQAGMGPAGAVLGCVVATYFTFLPSFLFILLGAPWIEQMRGELRLTAILSGITAAVVGVVAHLAYFFALRVFWPESPPKTATIDYLAVAIAGAAFVALWRFKAGIVQVVLACGAIGLIATLVHG